MASHQPAHDAANQNEHLSRKIAPKQAESDRGSIGEESDNRCTKRDWNRELVSVQLHIADPGFEEPDESVNQ